MWQQLGRSQRAKLAIVLGISVLYGCVLGSQFYVPRLVNALGGSATIAGFLLALSLTPVFIAAIFGRRIAQRWSARQILQAGLSCHVLQLVLLALAPNLFMLIPAMIFGGFGYAFSFAKLLTSATDILPKTHYAQGIAYFTLTIQMGVGLGSLMSAFVEPLLGTNGTFLIPMGLAVLSVYLAAELPMATISAPAAMIEPHNKKRGSLLEVFLLMGILGLTFGLPLQFVPMWLGKSTTMTFSPAYFLTTSFFSIMLSRMAFGHWLSGNREFRVVLVCFAIVSMTIAVLGEARTPLQFAACAFVYGATYSLLYPSCVAYMIKQVDPEERGAWSNWVLLGYEVGSRCLPVLFGIVADRWGFPVMFRLLALLIAVVGAWHLTKRLHHDKKSQAALPGELVS